MTKPYTNNSSSGFAIVLVLVLLVLAVLASVGAYFFLKDSSFTKKPQGGVTNSFEQAVPPVSNSTDLDVMDKEIDGSVVNSVDSDFKSLDASASTL